ncbi:hypothetical protein MEX01_05370 [Methylorubrum extorquens]|uniref:hypothetical protein n=1 Tax=Methylorubrum extorquens TaxID=408 RepID=UPI00116A9005|nr:hypothetical protein [Methylorubrum extorquens]GEL39946.1 hypothetical protein MEX01_05370 [Methylorubrum extorquens]
MSMPEDGKIQQSRTENPDGVDAEETLPGIISGEYNTVFERIMGRMAGENPIAPVVACVAYSLYKQEKRDWIVQRTQQLGRRPRQEEIDSYVSGWTDLRIDSVISQARGEIGSFAKIVLDSSKDEINDQIYKAQFQSLHDLIEATNRDRASKHGEIKSHVSERTKTSWGLSIGQNLLANFLWTAIVIIVILSLNVNFDFSNFSSRVRGFLNPPADSISQPPR